MDVRKAFCLYSKHFTRLRSLRNVYASSMGGKSRYLFFTAKGSFGKSDRKIDDDVVSLSFKEFMRLNCNVDVEIARYAATNCQGMCVCWERKSKATYSTLQQGFCCSAWRQKLRKGRFYTGNA